MSLATWSVGFLENFACVNMPRGKAFRRSQATKRQWAEWNGLDIQFRETKEQGACYGTGNRHRARRWPISVHTGCSHKLVLPENRPDKKVRPLLFVLKVAVVKNHQLTMAFPSPCANLQSAVSVKESSVHAHCSSVVNSPTKG